MTSVSPARRPPPRASGTTIGDRPTALRSIPDFKSTEAYAYPLVRDGRHLVSIPAQGDDDEAGRAARDAAEADATALVVICDDLFETVTGAPCGGPAEDARDPARRPLRFRGRSVGGVTGPLDLGLPRRIRARNRPEIANAGAPAPAFAVPEDPVVEGDRAVPWCVL